jgi:error-prone DNA polymerase
MSPRFVQAVALPFQYANCDGCVRIQVGKADALMRAMATWKREGGLDHSEDDVMVGMAQCGYSVEFANSIVGQIRGFAEYRFPASHAASFALMAYPLTWLKCHEPAAFLCALLNSQSMGFYSSSALIQDAKRHGVEVLPVDVWASGWESSLESREGACPAVRLGLNVISGMEQEAGLRIDEARLVEMFRDARDLAARTSLNTGHLNALASENALVSLSGNRRQALWQPVRSVPEKRLLSRLKLYRTSSNLTRRLTPRKWSPTTAALA